MANLGDFVLGATLNFKFTTVTTTGAPTTLAGTPVVSAYLDNSLTQLTAGITLTVDFDGVTGLNNVEIVATVANGYALLTNYQLVITTGTVGGTSVVGYVVAEFSIQNRNHLAVMRVGTAQAGSSTTITLDAGAESSMNQFYTRKIVYIAGGAGVGQSRQISNYVAATRVATINEAWAQPSGNPDATSIFAILPEGTPTFDTNGSVVATSVTNNIGGSVLGNVNGSVGGNVVGSVGSLTANNDKTGYALSAAGSAALTESYAADGATATLPQLLYMLLAVLTEASVTTTTLTANKLDGATAAATFTLNDGTNPTSITRAT